MHKIGSSTDQQPLVKIWDGVVPWKSMTSTNDAINWKEDKHNDAELEKDYNGDDEIQLRRW